MTNIFTIGFTQKTAETFFTLLKKNTISMVIDVRLNNTSQLASFSKYPDIVYFLNSICNISYKHDVSFAPTELTLSRYKKKEINWDEYVIEFSDTMAKREIMDYIRDNYKELDNLCLLCSEPTAKNCHRRLVAELFKDVFPQINIIHL